MGVTDKFFVKLKKCTGCIQITLQDWASPEISSYKCHDTCYIKGKLFSCTTGHIFCLFIKELLVLKL